MRTTPIFAGTAVHRVRDLYEAVPPVSSVYLTTSPAQRSEHELRRRRVVEDLAAQGADQETRRTLERRLAELGQEPGTAALFLADGQLRASFKLKDEETMESAVWNGVPRVLPVLRWFQERPPHVLALVDRTGADIVGWDGGAETPEVRTVYGPDDEIVRNAPGGRSQMRYQHRAEDSWQHNAARVADEIVQELDRRHSALLFLSGDVRALQFLGRYLPAWVRQQVRTMRLQGSRTPSEPDPLRDTRVREATLRASQDETARLLGAVADGLGPGGLGVDGVQATVDALATARVATLLVTDDPAETRTLWVGPGPTDLAHGHLPRPTDWDWARKAPLADAAVRSAILADADVRVLAPDCPGAPSDGMAALCRYA
jgi:hypothetical protein